MKDKEILERMDNKGRIFLSKDLKDFLKRKEIMVTKINNDEVYFWSLEEFLDCLSNVKRRANRRIFCSQSSCQEIDKGGRILIPAIMRKRMKGGDLDEKDLDC